MLRCLCNLGLQHDLYQLCHYHASFTRYTRQNQSFSQGQNPSQAAKATNHVSLPRTPIDISAVGVCLWGCVCTSKARRVAWAEVRRGGDPQIVVVQEVTTDMVSNQKCSLERYGYCPHTIHSSELCVFLNSSHSCPFIRKSMPSVALTVLLISHQALHLC